jgi:hypothetical protein
VTNLFRSKSLRKLCWRSHQFTALALSAWNWRLRWNTSIWQVALVSLTLPLSSCC